MSGSSVVLRAAAATAASVWPNAQQWSRLRPLFHTLGWSEISYCNCDCPLEFHTIRYFTFRRCYVYTTKLYTYARCRVASISWTCTRTRTLSAAYDSGRNLMKFVSEVCGALFYIHTHTHKCTHIAGQPRCILIAGSVAAPTSATHQHIESTNQWIVGKHVAFLGLASGWAERV